MLKLIILLTTFLAIGFINADAQDTWQILVNKKLIKKGNVGEEGAAFIKARTLKSKDCIKIKYKSENEESNWQRTFYINTVEDKVIKRVNMPKQSGSVCIKGLALKQLQKNKQPFIIYTTSLPNDPAEAATVRVRRIMLCKIEWN